MAETDIYSQSPAVYTQTFGRIPTDRINVATFTTATEAGTVFHAICNQEVEAMAREAATSADFKGYVFSESCLAAADELRTEFGALWLRHGRDLNTEIAAAHRTLGSFWTCMWATFCSRRFRPQKFYASCGASLGEIGSLSIGLANLTPRDQLVERWKLVDWNAHSHGVFVGRNELVDKEKEYRDLSVVIVQIGMGVGGMLLGLFGLVLSIAVSIIPWHK